MTPVQMERFFLKSPHPPQHDMGNSRLQPHRAQAHTMMQVT
jgi:hypothetical protein